MWLGTIAVAVAFGFAVVKFLTVAHARRLRDQHGRLAYEVKRDRQRLQALEGRLQVQRATCGSARTKLHNARRFKDDLYNRLRRQLPSALLPDLRQCINRHPLPEPEGVRTAHDLHLADKVSEALTQLSILAVQLTGEAETSTARVVLHGELVQGIEARGARHTQPPGDGGAAPEGGVAPGRRVVVSAFDTPGPAVDLLLELAAAHPESMDQLRGVLVVGVHITEFDREHVNRIFARTLHSTLRRLDDAPAGGLLVDAHARELLPERDDLVAHDGPEALWVLPLAATEAPIPEAADLAARDGTVTADPDPQDPP